MADERDSNMQPAGQMHPETADQEAEFEAQPPSTSAAGADERSDAAKAVADEPADAVAADARGALDQWKAANLWWSTVRLKTLCIRMDAHFQCAMHHMLAAFEWVLKSLLRRRPRTRTCRRSSGTCGGACATRSARSGSRPTK